MCTLQYIEPFRVMSTIIAMGLVIVRPDDRLFATIASHLDLPDVIKGNLEERIIPYLQAIKLDGYDSKKKRKMFVIGNTGMHNFEPINVVLI